MYGIVDDGCGIGLVEVMVRVHIRNRGHIDDLGVGFCGLRLRVVVGMRSGLIGVLSSRLDVDDGGGGGCQICSLLLMRVEAMVRLIWWRELELVLGLDLGYRT